MTSFDLRGSLTVSTSTRLSKTTVRVEVMYFPWSRGKRNFSKDPGSHTSNQFDSYIFYATEKTEQQIQSSIDEWGDSYARDVTVEQLSTVRYFAFTHLYDHN